MTRRNFGLAPRHPDQFFQAQKETMMKDIMDKCDVVLNADDPNFPEKFAEAIGAKPGETIEFITPQFTRTDGIIPSVPVGSFSDLANMPAEKLKSMGCCKWDEPNETGETLWLIPGEWYDHIPEGTILVCIDGSAEPFKRGETDNDTRYGCLAYGFMKKDSVPSPAEPRTAAGSLD